MKAKIALLLAAAALAGCAGGRAPTIEAALASLPPDSLPAYVEVTAHVTANLSDGVALEYDLLIRRDSAGYEYEEKSLRTDDGALQTLTDLNKPSDGSPESASAGKKSTSGLINLEVGTDRSSRYGAPEEYLPPVSEGGLWRFSPKRSSLFPIDVIVENGEVACKSRKKSWTIVPTIYYSPKSGRVEKVVHNTVNNVVITEFVWNSASDWPTSVSKRIVTLQSDGELKSVGDIRNERIQVKAVEPFSAESLFRERAR